MPGSIPIPIPSWKREYRATSRLMRGFAVVRAENDDPVVFAVPIVVNPVEKSPAIRTFELDPINSLFDTVEAIAVDVPV